ncbi:TPA: ash family protein [Providencia rettgeri]|nr:ash family protein [Providencia rettgeri]
MLRHSEYTPANSGVGIGVLNNITMSRDRACGFFMCKALLHLLNGGLCGGIERCAGLCVMVSGYANPVQFTTQLIGVSGGVNLTDEGKTL